MPATIPTILSVKQKVSEEADHWCSIMGSLHLVLIFSALLQYNFLTLAQHLRSELVSEGRCAVPPHLKVSPFVLQPRKYFVRLASKNFYYKFAEIFLGRPAISEQELNNGCQSLEISPDPSFAVRFNSTSTGYGQELNDSCDISGEADFVICNITNGVGPAPLVKSVHHILDTDNASFLLVYNCFIDGFGRQSRNYKLLTTTTELTLQLFDRVVPIIQSLAFDENKIHVPNLYHCEPNQPRSRIFVQSPVFYSYSTLPIY